LATVDTERYAAADTCKDKQTKAPDPSYASGDSLREVICFPSTNGAHQTPSGDEALIVWDEALTALWEDLVVWDVDWVGVVVGRRGRVVAAWIWMGVTLGVGGRGGVASDVGVLIIALGVVERGVALGLVV
jgi:hypothetical protein